MTPLNSDKVPFTESVRYNRRIDVHDKYGGNRQSGICPSANYPYIFIFSSKSGHHHGYEDLWLDDNIFRYTGEGQIGNMSFTRGNAVLRDHIVNEKKVLLFEKPKDGIGVIFRGELQLLSYDYLDAPDTEGNARRTIQFFFKKKGKSDYIPLALMQNPSALNDVAEVYQAKIPNKTERKGLVTSRVGQGAYRKSIIFRWKCKCAVSGFDNLDILIASHIIPWSIASDDQRLDVNNGLLLAPNYDALFDKRLISFENNGDIILSDLIPVSAYEKLGITGRERIEGLNEDNYKYLEHHRNLLRRKQP